MSIVTLFLSLIQLYPTISSNYSYCDGNCVTTFFLSSPEWENIPYHSNQVGWKMCWTHHDWLQWSPRSNLFLTSSLWSWCILGILGSWGYSHKKYESLLPLLWTLVTVLSHPWRRSDHCCSPFPQQSSCPPTIWKLSDQMIKLIPFPTTPSPLIFRRGGISPCVAVPHLSFTLHAPHSLYFTLMTFSTRQTTVGYRTSL